MADGRNAHRLTLVGQLVENSKGADSQRVEAPELASQRVSRLRLALKQAERLLDRVDQRPIEFEQPFASATRENQSRHRSVGCRSTPCQLLAQLVKRDRLSSCDLSQTGLECGECRGV